MSYILKFDLSGGSGSFTSITATAYGGSTTRSVTIPNKVPTMSGGRVFAYWQTAAPGVSGSGSATKYTCNQQYEFSSSDDVTLYAVYTQVSGRAVLYNNNGGQILFTNGVQSYSGFANTYITSGTKVPIPLSAPCRDGYSFVGWSDSSSTSPTDSANIASSGGYYTFSESKYPAGSVITMYAIWAKRNPVYVNIPSGKSINGIYINVPSGKTLKDIYVNR